MWCLRRLMMTELADRVAALGRKSASRSAERREALAREDAEKQAAAAQKREQLRAEMPWVAETVDRVRAVFGDVRVLAAKEGDKSVINRAACARAGVDWREYV